jgi:hypothetical protein
VLNQHLARTLEQALSSEQPLSRSFSSITYGMGAIGTFGAWQRGGPRGMDATWASPPRTMQRVMADLFGENTAQDAGILIDAPAIEGLQPYADDVLGAWGLYLLFVALLGGDPIGSALTWRGDHLWVYTDESKATYALWQVELESPQAARELAARLPSTLFIEREVSGRRLYMSYGVNGPSDPQLSAWGKAWLGE